MAVQDFLDAMVCSEPWKLRHLDVMDFACWPTEDALLQLLPQQSHLTQLDIHGGQLLYDERRTDTVTAGCLTDRFADFTTHLIPS